jgi:hypothetical protein
VLETQCNALRIRPLIINFDLDLDLYCLSLVQTPNSTYLMHMHSTKFRMRGSCLFAVLLLTLTTVYAGNRPFTEAERFGPSFLNEIVLLLDFIVFDDLSLFCFVTPLKCLSIRIAVCLSVCLCVSLSIFLCHVHYCVRCNYPHASLLTSMIHTHRSILLLQRGVWV